MHASFNETVFERYKDIMKELYNELMGQELLVSLLPEKTIPIDLRKNSKKENDLSRYISSSKKVPKAFQAPTRLKDIR